MPLNADEYGANARYADHYLEQYKLFVEMADRVSQRRDQSNRFYATIFSALAAVLLVAARFDLSQEVWEIALLAVGVVGATLAAIWFVNIKSYRRLNSAKFAVINQMEERLPVAGYTDEWEILRPKGGRPQYLQLSRVEQYVPVVFGLLALALTGYAVFLMTQ